MPRVDYDLYCEQDDTTTRLVLHAEGDPPVVLIEYDRRLAERSSRVAVISICGVGDPDIEYCGLRINFSPAKAAPE